MTVRPPSACGILPRQMTVSNRLFGLVPHISCIFRFIPAIGLRALWCQGELIGLISPNMCIFPHDDGTEPSVGLWPEEVGRESRIIGEWTFSESNSRTTMIASLTCVYQTTGITCYQHSIKLLLRFAPLFIWWLEIK